MGYTERDIDSSYQVFARYHQPPDEKSAANVFDEAEQKKLSDSDASARATKMQELTKLGVLLVDSGLFYLSLVGWLVLPDGEGPFPLHLIAHGNADVSLRQGEKPKEVKSYQGYRYLQQHLGNNGIASLAVNLNVVNALAFGDDSLQRVECLLLQLLLLKAVSGSPTTGTLPLSVKTGASALTPLATVLALQPPLAADSAQQKLRELKNLLAGKLNFSNLSFMGHSRGANAAADVFPFFGLSAPAPSGTAPSGSTPPRASPGLTAPTINRPQDSAPNPNTLSTLAGLVANLGNPSKDVIKCIVALQPADPEATINHPGVFFLAFSSSHDSDVEAKAINIYEAPVCAKASVFSHGATHQRFNAIWRELESVKRMIDQDIRCQTPVDPIRILSNQGHEDLAKNFLGDALLATQTAQPSKLKLYTGEARATIKQDVERMWKFAFPFSHAPSILELDSRVTEISNRSSGAATALTKTSSGDVTRKNPASGQDQKLYEQVLDVFRIEKPARETHAFSIAIQGSDALADFTHFSFRYAKEYNPFSKSERAAEPLRNFEIRLFSGTNPIGSPVAGNKISAILQRAYPTMKASHDDFVVCSDKTSIMLQTQELPLMQFFNRSSMHTISDLPRVDKIELRLLPSSGRANDIYLFLDFVLTYRVFP